MRDAVGFADAHRPPGENATASRISSRRDERRVQAQARQREAEARKPFEKRLAAIESELAALTAEARELEAWLASTDAYADAQRERLQEALKRRGEVQARVGALEDEWLWSQAAMERAVGEARGRAA
jgi:ATP-binding cassette subfamily F protein 3